MTDHVWHIGIFGTFDVQNYGDLLFPLIAEAELTKRLGRVKVDAFSYQAKRPPEWPYTVTSLTELSGMAGSLEGVLIGGGHLIRFDREVAPGYGAPTTTIHHPTGYWLTPALIALQQGIPVIWNAPGTYGEIPTWAQPLMKLSLKLSSYIAVRDEPSRSALTHLADGAQIDVTPDTAFGISRLLDDERPTAEFIRLREDSGLTGTYIVVQATPGMESYKRFLQSNSHLFPDFRLLALPIGPVLGDNEAILDDLPGVVRLSKWPHPLLLAEIISQASGVVGRSYHLMITALAFGVPVFSIADLSFGKHIGLSPFKTIYTPPKDSEIDPHWFFTRLGKTAPSHEALATLDQLSDHWDRVADAIRKGPTATQATLNRFWQSLPGLLEHSDELSKLLTLAREDIESRDDRIAQLSDCIAHRDDHITQRDERIAQIYNSPSWKVTVPARFLMRNLKHLLNTNGNNKRQRQMMDLAQIGRQPLQTQPYAWAAIGSLFSPKDAKALADSFPCDHFKTVTGYDSEKDYEYEARALIAMGASTVSNAEELSEAWLALAHDFLSPAYRSRMSLLTGLDLNTVAMEVNVFHYGPRARLGAHVDLHDKLVTHVLYFNRTWNTEDGGCFTVLRSSDPNDVAAEVPPLIGNSSVVVRSDNSWHAVSPVVHNCPLSRRSLTATFYRPGSVSTMWPPGDNTPLHRYDANDLRTTPTQIKWERRLNRLAWWKQ
jgi:hypothetical protein